MKELDVKEYYAMQEMCHEDKALHLPTSFGFVVAPDGKLYHLNRQYCHGVIIAYLERQKAEEDGIGLPKRNEHLDVYGYQDFMFKVVHDIQYICVAFGVMYNRISFDSQLKVSKEQLDTMKKYFHNTLINHETFMTDFGDVSGDVLLRELDKLHNHQKMNGGFVQDVELIVPVNESGLGEL